MPENWNQDYEIKLQNLLKSIEETVAKYKQEIEQQVKEAKDRNYEDFPVELVQVQSITETNTEQRRPKAIGILSHPAYKRKTTIVENGGRIK